MDKETFNKQRERYEKLLDQYITQLGYRPACPTICVPKMLHNYDAESGVFPFFINPHNLAWYAEPEWRSYGDNGEMLERPGSKIVITFRDLVLSEIGI